MVSETRKKVNGEERVDAGWANNVIRDVAWNRGKLYAAENAIEKEVVSSENAMDFSVVHSPADQQSMLYREPFALQQNVEPQRKVLIQ
jgi:hypothetical protein